MAIDAHKISAMLVRQPILKRIRDASNDSAIRPGDRSHRDSARWRAVVLHGSIRAANLDIRRHGLQRVVDKIIEGSVTLVIPSLLRVVPESLKFAPYFKVLYVGVAHSNLPREFCKILEVFGKRCDSDALPIIFRCYSTLHPIRRAAQRDYWSAAGLPHDRHTTIEGRPIVDACGGFRILYAPAHNEYVLVMSYAANDGFSASYRFRMFVLSKRHMVVR